MLASHALSAAEASRENDVRASCRAYHSLGTAHNKHSRNYPSEKPSALLFALTDFVAQKFAARTAELSLETGVRTSSQAHHSLGTARDNYSRNYPSEKQGTYRP